MKGGNWCQERRMDDRSEVAVWPCLELWRSVEDANCCVLMCMCFLFLPSWMLAYVRCSFSKVCIMKSSACSYQVLAFILKVTERFEEWDKFGAQVLNMTSLKTCDTLKKMYSVSEVVGFVVVHYFCLLLSITFFMLHSLSVYFSFLVMSFPFHFGYVFPFHFGYVFPFHFGYRYIFSLWLYLLSLVMSFPFHFYCHLLMNLFNIEPKTLTMGKL